MMRKIFAFTLALLLLLSFGPTLAVEQPSEWAQSEVTQAQQLGLVPPALQQRYQESITRLEFCHLAIRFLENKTQLPVQQFLEDKRLSLPPAFDDCGDLAVLQASALGITNGRGDNLFAPDASITREEAATMLHRLNRAILGQPLVTSYSLYWDSFSDRSSISSWAQESITFVVQTENPTTGMPIMQGTATNYFSPKAAYTIEQSILTILRLHHAVRYQECGMWIGSSNSGGVRPLGYDSSNYGAPLAGRLFANGGGYDMVMLNSEAAVVYKLDADLVPLRTLTISKELQRVVGAHQNEAGEYFLAFAQDNLSEAANREVLRLVRYGADWQRQAATSVTGGPIITRQPVYAGSLQMADDGTHLTVLTTRERFLHSDGLRHQSNLSLTFDMADMRLLYSSDPYPANHVSHSFNQHLLYDGESLVTLDHGDAFPRSLVLHLSDYRMSGCKSYALTAIPGSSGANYTGVTQGGLAATESHYIVAYNTIDQRQHGQMPFERNAVLALLPRSNPQSGFTYLNLTDFPTGSSKTASAPQLVPLPDGRVVVLWEVFERYQGVRTEYMETRYVVLNGAGEFLGDIQSCNRRISAAYPAVFLNGQLLAPNLFSQYPDEQSHLYINRIDLSMFE